MKEGYVLKADAAKYLTPEPITYAAMKRKSEKAAQNALEDARVSVMRAAGIGRVETYCINTVLAELKRKGLSPEQEEYKRISRETARMVIRDRKGLWTRYYTDKEGLKDWILWKLLRIVHRDEVRRRKAPEVAERVPDRYGSSRTLRRNLLHIRGRSERVERVLRVIISAVDERAEQQRLERRYDFTTEEKVRTGTWTNMQQ